MIREPRLAEAEALAELLNAHSTELFGEADLAVDTVRHWFDVPGIWIRVVEDDRGLVGYLDVAREDEGARFDIDARALNEGAAAETLAAAEAYCHERVAQGAIARGYAPAVDARMHAAYEQAGFGVVRHFFDMRIELVDERPPEWPEGIVVRTFRSDDEDAVWDCNNEAFEDHWDHRPPTAERRAGWRHNMLGDPSFDPELWFLAEDGADLAGVSLCGWHNSGDRSFGWVHVLGVRRPWRRRGLALALLRHSFAESARRGATRVGLGVDAASPTGAVGLYERAGMHVQRRTEVWEKQL